MAFALLLFFGVSSMFSSTPDTSGKTADDVARRWASWATDSGNRTSVVIGGFLTVLAALALVWFASALRTRVAAGPGPLMAFAVLAAGAVIASTFGPLAITGGHAFGDDPVPTSGDGIWLLFSLAFPALLVGFGLSVAAFIASVVVAGRRVLPTWLVVFGWLAVVAGIFAVEFLPLFVVLLWFVAAGAHGAVRPGPVAPDPAG